SGVRVSEITALTCQHVCFGASTFVQLTGKGRKERTVPLWPTTSQVLKTWFAELGAQADRIAFPSAKGKALSRDGVAYLLQQALPRALPACPSLATKHISPHVIRHNPAYLLTNGASFLHTIYTLVFYKLNSAIERGTKPDALGWNPCHWTSTLKAAIVNARRA